MPPLTIFTKIDLKLNTVSMLGINFGALGFNLSFKFKLIITLFRLVGFWFHTIYNIQNTIYY